MRADFSPLGFSAPGIIDHGMQASAESSQNHYRAVFISDLHLGTPGCQAQALLAFIKAHPSDYLYLVGDIVDGWQLRRRWYWPGLHNDVVQKLLRRAEMRNIDGVLYCNDGDWVESCSALIEHHDGHLELRHWTAQGVRQEAAVSSL